MLTHWMNWMRTKVREQAGQGLVEYALIVVLIAIALIVVLSVLSGGIGSAFSRVTSSLGL